MIGIPQMIAQRSDEWLEIRRGLVTGSKIGRAFTEKLNISKAGCKSLGKDLACETIESKEITITEAMQNGMDREKDAIELLKVIGIDGYKDHSYVEDMFFLNDKEAVAASPDLYLTGEGNISGVEIKCPTLKYHVEYLENKEVPAKYLPQIYLNMMVVGCNEWFFMSYFPKVKPLVLRVKKEKEFENLMLEAIKLVKEHKEHYLKIIKGETK